MSKSAIVIVFALLALLAWREFGVGERLGLVSPDSDSSQLANAFEQRQSDVQIQGEGEVLRILSDDNDGSRHQRFILRMDSGQTLLVAHNIDLAPRIPSLRVGDLVKFYGEYEWNPQGGVIHWTHHDPGGRHVDGWLKHREQTYQ